MTEEKVITGDAFLNWLFENGIIPDRTRRVVIDASYDAAVLIYIEKFGTNKLINVQPPAGLDKATKVILE